MNEWHDIRLDLSQKKEVRHFERVVPVFQSAKDHTVYFFSIEYNIQYLPMYVNFSFESKLLFKLQTTAKDQRSFNAVITS